MAPEHYRPYYIHSKNELGAQCADCHGREGGRFRFARIEQQVGCVTDSCHPKMGTASQVHGPLLAGNCVGCHSPHGSLYKDFVIAQRQALCYRCHTTERDAFKVGNVHFPVAKGECLACHDPHQSELDFHLRADSIAGLCAKCHNPALLNRKFIHKPVASGDCVACHQPHTSPFKYLLYEDGEDMCLTCHAVRKEEFQQKYIHEPVKKNCTLCHDPHGSQVENHLRITEDAAGLDRQSTTPVADLCRSCHARLDPLVDNRIAAAPVQHKPVREGKCLACHTPHSTNYPKQLRQSVKATCYFCHERMKKHIEESAYKHGPVQAGQCTSCHQVHGSVYPKLLTARFSSAFYGDFDLKEYTLCFNCHNAKMVLDPANGDTGFRNGGKNLHYLHVNRKKGRNCKTCHDIHASSQPHHLREKIPYRGRLTISLQYTQTKSGGGCVVGCHKPRTYDRQHAQPVQ